MSQVIRKILFWSSIIIGGILVFLLINVLMAWSLYSWFFQTIRDTSSIPDTINGAISIWLVVFTVALIPTVFSLIFWRKSLKKVAIVAGAASAWLLFSYFISQPGEGQYFNKMTGQPMYRYARTQVGQIELFPLGYKFHPKYGTKLELVTTEIIKEIDDQKMREQKEIQELEKKRQALEAKIAHQREEEKRRADLSAKEQQREQEERKKEQEGQAQEEEQKQPVQEEQQPEPKKIPAPATGLTIREIFGSPNAVRNTNIIIKPMYPAWMRRVLRPELENIGPVEFGSSHLRIWFHPSQIHGYAKGYAVYEYLKENDMLNDCLNLQDLRGIQGRGVVYFRKLFPNRNISLCAWKSVIESNDGFLYVPHLTEMKDNNLTVCWTRLDFFFFEDAPAGMFVK